MQTDETEADGIDALLSKMEAAEARERAEELEIHVLKQFGEPGQKSTMGHLSRAEVNALCLLKAQSDWVEKGVPFLKAYFDAKLLLSRSQEGWGSEQMVRVITQRPQPTANRFWSFFGGNTTPTTEEAKK